MFGINRDINPADRDNMAIEKIAEKRKIANEFANIFSVPSSE